MRADDFEEEAARDQAELDRAAADLADIRRYLVQED